ncbi:hypothetical protein ACNOYE_25610 [Nannocystaceae bacterium ST9]
MHPRWSGSLAIVLSCAREPSVVEPTTSGSIEQRERRPESTTEPALERLAALAVHHDDFARAEFYTWTTPTQLESLRAGRCLLQADASSGGQASPFNLALQAIASAGSADAPIAALLIEHDALVRRRYAWPNPFATALGLGPRRYGDVLIRIELDPSSLLARFEPGGDPVFVFVDMQGEPVPRERVLADPLRLAAVYHVASTAPDEPAYREYVICSEAMIASWSVATPEIAARVEAEIELLAALADSTLAHLPRAAIEQRAAIDWTTPSEPTPLASWHASLAFDNQRYRPTPAGLRRIAEALAETRNGEPLIHPSRTAPCRP